MYSRWFNMAVVMLWLVSMTWLVQEKVLPTLREGEPPSYRTIVEAQRKNPVVGWKMSLDGHELGYALSEAKGLEDGLTEIHSRVHFDNLPLEKMLPAWLKAILQLSDYKPLDNNLSMDTVGLLTIDPLGRLTDFESTLRIDPLAGTIKLQGTVEGTKLKVTATLSGVSHSTEAYMPPKALVADAFSPQTQLPGLRQGQTWKVPVYSPLRPPSNPMEILEAKVERLDLVKWNGRTEELWLVEYRRDSGFGFGGRAKPQGRLWVRRDGTVLKQQMMIMNSTLTFVRMTDEEAAESKLLPLRQ